MRHYRSGMLLLIAVAWTCLCCTSCEIRETDSAPTLDHGRPFEATDADAPPDGLDAGQMVFASLEHGYQTARAQQKPLLVFFTAGWCKYCHQMANETFTQQAVVQLSRRFVCVQVDADAQPQVCREFDVQGFPTVQFVSPSGVRLNRVTGKQSADRFLAQMNAALHTLARRPELNVLR